MNGLVVEGGGTKIAYTGGVLQCFLEQGITFPYCVGVSAGAEVLMAYVSRQPDRLRVTCVDGASQKGLIGLKPILEEGSVFALERTARFIEEKTPLDYETFLSSPTRLDIGVYDLKDKKTYYYPKEYVDDSNDLIIASCSLLLLSQPRLFDGKNVVDAGLTDMIPLEQAEAVGCDRFVVISTKEEGYRRKPASKLQILGAKIVYRDKKIVDDFRNRHLNYNEQWKQIEELERQGKCLVLRPHKDMGITRYTTDRDKLAAWYQLGYDETLDRIDLIRDFLKGKKVKQNDETGK